MNFSKNKFSIKKKRKLQWVKTHKMLKLMRFKTKEERGDEGFQRF